MARCRVPWVAAALAATQLLPLLIPLLLLDASPSAHAFIWESRKHLEDTSGADQGQQQGAAAAEDPPAGDEKQEPEDALERLERQEDAAATATDPPAKEGAAARQRLPVMTPGAEGFATLEDVQARCYGAPYPLVFGTKVRLPDLDVDKEILAKKKAVGFFGGTVKNPGAKNQGTPADRMIKEMHKGKRKGSRNLLLNSTGLSVDEEGAAGDGLLLGVGGGVGGAEGTGMEQEEPREAAGSSGGGGGDEGGRWWWPWQRRRLLGKLDSLPLVPRCAKEKTSKRLREGEEHLKECIEKPHLCPDWKVAQKAAWELSGIQSLGKRLNCLTVNRQCKSSSALIRAPETGRQITSSQQSMLIRSAPQIEVPRKFKTCAVVGNGPGLKMGGHKLGHIIDKHDAVIKYNLKSTGSRPGKLSDEEQEWHGTRSNYRIMNKKRSEAPLVDAWWGGLRPSTDPEHWIYWNYGTAVYYRGIKGINPLSYMVSPEYQTWLVQSYFALRTDMYRVGIATGSKPLQCPVNISSGIHGLWFAFQMCESINLYGFSWNLNMLGDRTDGPSVRVSGSHSWDFDTMVLKVLALSGKINVCTS